MSLYEDKSRENGRARYVLFTFFWKLVYAGILFVLFSLPVVTIPAAVCGLHGVVQQLFRKGYGDTVREAFIREFKKDFLPRTLWFFLLLLLMAVPVMLLVQYSFFWLYVLVAAVFGVVLSVLGWFVPQVVLTNLRPWEAIRNAILLLLLESRKSLLMVLMRVFAAFLVLLLSPISLVTLCPLCAGFLVLGFTAISVPVLLDRIVRDEPEE